MPILETILAQKKASQDKAASKLLADEEIQPKPTVISEPELITKPATVTQSSKRYLREEQELRSLKATKSRLIISSPQEKDTILDKQADEAMNSAKNATAPIQPDEQTSKSQPTVTRGPIIPTTFRMPTPPISFIGPKKKSKRKATMKVTTSIKPVIANPVKQAQGILMYRTLSEAVAARPAPKPKAPTAEKTNVATIPPTGQVVAQAQAVAEASKKGSPITRPAVNRQPTPPAPVTENSTSPIQEPLTVAQELAKELVTIKKPEIPSIKDILLELKASIPTIPVATSSSPTSTSAKLPAPDPKSYKRESQAKSTAKSIQSPVQEFATQLPTPPTTTMPTPVVAPVSGKPQTGGGGAFYSGYSRPGSSGRRGGRRRSSRPGRGRR